MNRIDMLTHDWERKRYARLALSLSKCLRENPDDDCIDINGVPFGRDEAIGFLESVTNDFPMRVVLDLDTGMAVTDYDRSFLQGLRISCA